ncbi:hypothetical protein C4577_04260 [Candidatus Parcubacteria bacterium]|nr:MAG: hypothetical protein C4577_04260 [Candidatus Parcubacteria bacterium]
MKRGVSSPEAYKLFHDGIIVLSEIEANGIKIDTELLKSTIKATADKVKEIKEELQTSEVWKVWKEHYADKANIGSGQQLAHVLFDIMKIKPVVFTEKGSLSDLGFGKISDGLYYKPSTSEKALQDIDHPFVRRLFDMKGYEKVGGTFLKGIKRELVDGFIHPFFDLHTARTFRSSSKFPNFQNIPKRDKEMAEAIRKLFIPREKGWHFWETDFKGAEVVTASCVTGDRALRAYVSDKNKDMHRDTGGDLFLLPKDSVKGDLRHISKNQFVFAEFYGSYYKLTAKAIWDTICREKKLFVPGTEIHIKDHLASKGISEGGLFRHDEDPEAGTFEYHVKEVERIFWHERFPEYTKWKKKWFEQYQKEGGFRTVTGFWIEGPLTKNAVLNYPIQGPAFHCLLWFLINMQKWLRKNKMRTKLVGQIHDSCEGNSPPDEIQDVLGKANELVTVDLPKHFSWITAPMSVEVAVAPPDGSWFDMKEWKCFDGVWKLAA